MKNIFSLLAILFLVASVKAQNPNREPYLTRSLSKEAIQNIYARTSGGSIEVKGSSGNYRLEVYVSGNNNREILSKEEIKTRLEQEYDLDISTAGNKLSVVAKPKQKITNWKKGLNISFKIFVPQRVSTDLATSGGSINLSNLTGNHDFRTSGGSLNLETLVGNIDGKTSGGSIHIKNSSSTISLHTSGGSINAANCKGEIELKTSGGSLNLKNLDGNIEASTSGGSVNGTNIKGSLDTHTSGGSINLNELSGDLDASTSGGGMNIDIVKAGKFVKLANSGGNIHLKMPDKPGLDLKLSGQKINVNPLNNFSGSKEDEEINGRINGGGIPVNVRAGSGRITVAFR